MNNQKHISLRLDKKMHSKLSYIAEYEGRSINRQISHIIRNAINDMEKKYGEIKIEEKPNPHF